MNDLKSCKFLPGQIINHARYHYRGVIVDVDESCQADEQWYTSNKTQPNRDQPWYHVLVDQEMTTTYVAEENLTLDFIGDPIEHPLVEQFFTKFKDGKYFRQLDG